MSETRTDAKVTKLHHKPSVYYSPQKTVPTAPKAHPQSVIAKKAASHSIAFSQIKEKTASILRGYKEAFVSQLVQTKELIAGGSMALCSVVKREVLRAARVLLSKLQDRSKKLVISGAASLVMTTLLGTVVFGTCSLGCHVKLDDKEIGTLPNEERYYEILSDVKEEVLDTAEVEFEPSGELSVSTVLIGRGQFSETEEVKERLKSTSSEMVPAWGISVDGKTVIGLMAQEDALEVLEEYKALMTEEGAFASFQSRVEVKSEFVPVQIMKTKDEALRFFAEAEEPVILVRSSVACETTEAIPFAVETQNDPNIYVGEVRVLQSGKEGKRHMKYYSVRVNGEEVERTVMEEAVLSAPVAQVERVGTKPPPSPVGTGSFAQPASGTLSSNFGKRWGRNHEGIDIAASVGTMIYASDNGVVTYSEYHNGGYGYMITIDHGNGYTTSYAHCSKLLVPEGAVVAKGDAIAKVGNTGRSTGPHLHFEIRKNDAAQNPLNYLK